MALLVTDQGEIDSLRTLLNATHEIPRNLMLKLYTAPTVAPLEQDTPSQTKYYEPYNANNSHNNGAGPTTGYPSIVNNRTEENQKYTDQYGKLLNGNRWDIQTKEQPVATGVQVTGTSGNYGITVNTTDDIKKGDYLQVTGGIPANTYVVDIDGTNIELSQKLTANMTATPVDFGRGRTTASYPEEVFTFSGPAGDVYGYFLARANNMPHALAGKLDGGTVAAGTAVEKPDVKGVIGNKYIELKDNPIAGGAISAGAQNGFVITITTNANKVKKGQKVTGTNIPDETRVVGISGNDIYIDKAITGGNATGNATFTENVAEDLTVGMTLAKTSGQSGPDAIPANTKIVGIDYATNTGAGDQGPRLWIDKALTDNIGTASSNDKVDFGFSVVTSDPGGTAVAHGLNVGDVIYIAQGSTSTITAAHYTIASVPTNSTFTTTPAMQGTGDATLHNSLFFAEKFTNGPYSIQNSGDQIKVTLNVSLD